MLSPRRLARQYHVTPETLLRAALLAGLPVEERRSPGGRTWRRVDPRVAEALKGLGRGPFGRETPQTDPLTPSEPQSLTIRQAAALTGLSPAFLRAEARRGRLRAQKVHGRWLVRSEDLRTWALPRQGQAPPDLSWLHPTSPEQYALALEFFATLAMAAARAREEGIPLPKMWSGDLIHAMHERQKPVGSRLPSRLVDRNVRNSQGSRS